MTDQRANVADAESNAKVVELKVSETFGDGQEVYLSETYYTDLNTSLLEIPKYGWRIKALVDDVATIEYQRPNLKLLMTVMLDTRYLKKEV